jgi:hypothetical protein
MGTTGVVIKNDVHARGCSINQDGTLQWKHQCSHCCKAFTDTEDVYYVFAYRGTQSAVSAYYHPGCAYLRKESQKRWTCRLCGNKNSDLRLALPYRRGVWCHHKCLSNVSREIVPVDQIPERVRKRTRERLKRGVLHYAVTIQPYKGLVLLPSKVPCGDDNILVTVRTYDGKINSVQAPHGIGLTVGGRWVSEDLLMEQIGSTVIPNKTTQQLGQTLKQVLCDFREACDSCCRPKNGRLDSDFNLRFLLKYGNSIEGYIDESFTK